MGISALGAGLSGMNANLQGLAVEGHNVANMNTANYTPREVSFQESSPAGSGVTISAQGMRMSAAEGGTDLASSMTKSLTYKAGFELAVKVIKAADERIGTLIDISA